MKVPTRPRWQGWIVDFFACFFIPTYTLLFTHETPLFRTNFSVIGALTDRRTLFFLWGLLMGIYLLWMLYPLTKRLPHPLPVRLCLLTGFLLLMTAVILPYLPHQLPKISDLHVISAFSASCLLVLALFLLLCTLLRHRGRQYWKCFKWLGLIVLISIILFLLTGFITSALEVFFAISVTLLARKLWRMEYRLR